MDLSQQIKILQKIELLYRQILMLMKKKEEVSKNNIIYKTAKSYLGKDMAKYQDEYGCAEALIEVVRLATGIILNGGFSTYLLYGALKNSKNFTQVKSPERGDILISPSGTGNGRIKNGHVGIVSDKGFIMSNNSNTALWDEHINTWSWEYRYKTIGGFPMLYYRYKENTYDKTK